MLARHGGVAAEIEVAPLVAERAYDIRQYEREAGVTPLLRREKRRAKRRKTEEKKKRTREELVGCVSERAGVRSDDVEKAAHTK